MRAPRDRLEDGKRAARALRGVRRRRCGRTGGQLVVAEAGRHSHVRAFSAGRGVQRVSGASHGEARADVDFFGIRVREVCGGGVGTLVRRCGDETIRVIVFVDD